MEKQLALFAPPERARTGTEVAPAAASDALEALGRLLPDGVHAGTSSWAFPGWGGLVYDRPYAEPILARFGLAAYSHHPVLRAVGIDRTFYAPLSASAFAAYANQVPEGFRFLVKAPSAVTDGALRGERGKAIGPNRHFLDAQLALESFVRPALDGLGAKAGPLVFQLSPLGRETAHDPRALVERLRQFFAALRRALTAEGRSDALLAVELRDPDLLGEALAEALAESGTRYCFGVHARMPSIAAQAAALSRLPRGPLVARWNLHAGYAYEQAKERYAPFDRLVDEDPETRSALVRLCVEAVAAGQPSFVIANNKAEGSAPLTIVKFAEALVGAVRQHETTT